MEFTWDFFTIALLIELVVAVITSAFVWLIPFFQLCCLRSNFRRTRWYGKRRDQLMQLMLSFAAGLLAQSLVDNYVTCIPGCGWVSIIVSLIFIGLAMLLFWCTDGWVLYLFALAGLYWILNQLWHRRTANTWEQNLALFLEVIAVLLAAVFLLGVKARIRAIILEWIIAAIACAIIVYFVDYVRGASLDIFTGPAIDLFGPEEYPGQTLEHIIEMTVLYAVNRAAAVSAALALQCFSKDPNACGYRCRNSCCCCCCETDPPTEQEVQLARQRHSESAQASLFDYDYEPDQSEHEDTEAQATGETGTDSNRGEGERQKESSDDNEDEEEGRVG